MVVFCIITLALILGGDACSSEQAIEQAVLAIRNGIALARSLLIIQR